MTRRLWCCSVGLVVSAAAALVGAVYAQPSYTNQDINQLKSRYQVRKSGKTLPAAYPSEFDRRPFATPKLVPWMLPYAEWTAEYRDYFQRHYHDPKVRLEPTLICMHYTVSDNAEGIWNAFARGCEMSNGNKGTVFGHVSVHAMVDQDATVYQLLPFDRRCTGAYGVNHKAISIEMVAVTEADLLSRPNQVYASFNLVRHLMKKYRIGLDGIIAHYEVSQGKSVVPDYLDFADSEYPDRYPSKYFRSDPGPTYMAWLRSYLRKNPP